MVLEFAILHRKSPEVQLPYFSSWSIAAMVPQRQVQPGRRIWNFPKISFENVQMRRNVAVKSNRPLVSPNDHSGNLAVLFSAGVFGIWSEKTKMGSALSGPIVSTLLGFAASNFGIIASDASTFPIVTEFLLPLAYPMMLFRADLRRVTKPTRTLLSAFLLGSVGTTIGSTVAFLLVPMPSFGQVLWSLGAFLMGTHVGVGAAFMHGDISDAFEDYSSVWIGGLAVNNVTRAVYFATLFALASKVPLETTTVSDGTDVGKDTETEYNNKLPVLQFATSLAVSFSICKVGSYLTKYFGIRGGTMPAITTVAVILATIFPKSFAYLAPSGEAMATILMQVFFVVLGARENISAVNTAPHIFMFSLIQIFFHFAITFGLGKWLHFDLKSLLIASIGNVGGPTAVCGMAAAKGWSSMVIPGILAGILKIPIEALLGFGFLCAFSKK